MTPPAPAAVKPAKAEPKPVPATAPAPAAEWVFPVDRTAELPAMRLKQAERRVKQAQAEEADRKAMEAIMAEQKARAAVKAKASKAKSKAKAKGELRKMPLEGKAALALINQGK